jgi:aldehyde:ferredoxin oxidoreductase
MKYHGYAGQILYIDLTGESIRKEPLELDLIKNFIGGMGINSKLAFDLIKPGVGPLSPENVICYGAGPFVGTLIPGCSRSGIISKSPLTGLLGESQSGVSIGPMLKYAGYDHLVITGRAAKPVYVVINDDDVKIKDASHIWGKEIAKATDAIRAELGDYWVSCIGPAGERLVRFANIIENKNGMIARCGLGAVMGSKNLKAIAVRGTKGITVSHSGTFRKMVNELRQKVAGSQVLDMWRNEGKIIEPYQGAYMKRGIYVTKNFSEGLPEGVDEYFTQKEYAQRIWKTYYACVSCPAGDKGVLSVKGGKYDGLTLKLSNPWGTPISFNQAGIRNWDDGIQCVEMANRYGIDAFLAGVLIGFANELYQDKIISKEDTGGLDLDWSADAALKLMEKIAHREDIGDILAEGVRIASQKIGRGAEKYAVHIKGLTPTMELRSDHFVENFGQLVDPRGGHHARGYSITYVPRKGKSIRRYAPLIGVPGDAIDRICPDSEIETHDWNRPRLLKWVNDYNSMAYSCGLCMRVQISPQYNLETFTDLFNATTGIEMSSHELLKAGERIWNIQRLFNVREGASWQDDMPPQRMLNEPLVVGEKQYPPLKERDVRKLLEEYYDESGWDTETGKPTVETLKNLGLGKEGE